MPITTTIEGRPIAQFPDGTSPDVIQRVMKGIAAQIQGVRKDTMTGQVVQPTPKPALQEGQRNPQDPAGMMESMIVPRSNTPSKPFRPIRNVLAAGAEGVNLGMMGAASGLNTMYNYLNEKLEAGARPDFFKKAVEEYGKNAQYWESVAQRGGISKALHFLGKAIGEAPAGIADFVAGVGPAAVKGAARAKEKGENEWIGAGRGAAERFLMGKVLHAANQLKTLPRVGASAGVFGAQTAAQGGTPEQIGEAAVTGAMYGMPGKGRVGIKELGENATELNKEIGERGSIGKKPDVDPTLTQDTAAQFKKQYTEDKQETPLWLDKGFLPAVKVDGKVHLTGTGHKYMADIPGIPEAKELETGWVNIKTGMFSDRKGTDWDAAEPKPGLVPAVRQGKTVVKGGVGDTHPDVMKAHNIGPEAEHERGFVGPDGKFMTRARAKQWMKKNNPELYKEWVKTVEEGGEGKSKELHSQDLNKAQGLPEEKKDTTLGMGLGGAQDTILKGLDRWLSPTKEHLKKQGEGKMPAEEWIKRVEAWGSKNPHIKDENQWNGLKAWLESKKGEKGGVKKDDIMEMLELGKGKWAVREQVYGRTRGEISDKEMQEWWEKRQKEDNTSFSPIPYDKLNDQTKSFIKERIEDESGLDDDPWADRNVPGGIPGTAKVWTLSLPYQGKAEYEGESTEYLREKQKVLLKERQELEKKGDYAASNKLSDQQRQVDLAIRDIEKGKVLYGSPHFPDKPNVVIHFRTQEIKDSTGEKGLLIETIQSDWHQERGKDMDEETQKLVDKVSKILPNKSLTTISGQDLMRAGAPSDVVDEWIMAVCKGKLGGVENYVPPAPFEKSWAEVGLKHALDIAAQDPSIKWVGWSSGKVQNERWGKGENIDVQELPEYDDIRDDYIDQLSKEYADRHNGKYPDEEDDMLQEAIMDKADDMAVALLKKRASGTFLETLYDKRLPKFAKKYVEKLGGVYKDDSLKQDHGRISDEEEAPILRGGEPPLIDSYPIHRIDLTTPLRTHINTKGQEFYQMGGPVVGAAVKAVMGEDEEDKFQKWIRSLPWFDEFKRKYGEEPNLDSKDYDYRAAWKAGVKPTVNKYDGLYHWSSGYLDKSGKQVWLKSQDHPTAWMQHFLDETGKDPQSLGIKTKQEGDEYLTKWRRKKNPAKEAFERRKRRLQ